MASVILFLPVMSTNNRGASVPRYKRQLLNISVARDHGRFRDIQRIHQHHHYDVK